MRKTARVFAQARFSTRLANGLSVSPVDWFRFSLVGQRTRAYQTDVDIQRGLLVGFSYKKIDFTTYVFNLDAGKPMWVFSVGVSF